MSFAQVRLRYEGKRDVILDTKGSMSSLSQLLEEGVHKSIFLIKSIL